MYIKENIMHKISDPYGEQLNQKNGGWSNHPEKRQNIKDTRKDLFDHNQKIANRQINKPKK